MSTYIFIPGKDPELSIAELKARYALSKMITSYPSFILAVLSGQVDQKEFDHLGGQLKSGRLFATVGKKDLIKTIADHLTEKYVSGKLNYGLSLYGWPEKNLRPLLRDMKNEFKKRSVPSRFANQHFANLSTAQYKGLRGPEIIIARHGEDFNIAEVVAVQDIDAYSKRDYKKPFRNMKIGMLPPKLAQIMINLAGDSKKIWDPFCGGGVLIMEGLLMEREMTGSDIDAKALEGAEGNIEWLRSEFRLKPKAKLFQHDATRPFRNEKFDAVVFEGYLGPPQSRLKNEAELRPLVSELTKLYSAFFRNLKNFRGPIVAALPFFRCRDGELRLTQLLESIEKEGFREELDLDYARPDQWVGRQILRFRL